MTREDWQGVNSKDSNVTIRDNIFNFGSSEQISESIPLQNLSTSGGEVVPFDKLLLDHKYANLVVLKIHFLNWYYQVQTQQLSTILHISFGEVEENFIEKESNDFVKKEGSIRFGIKFGRLCLKLTNGCMPLEKRKVPKVQDFNGDVTFMGTDENPEWQFKVKHKAEIPEKASVLFGSLSNQELGIMELQNTSCQVEATFQVKININDLGITSQDGVWDEKTNKKKKHAKICTFFKNVVEPKLKDYVSKLVLQYDSTTIS
ncbi:MAG: hypothetical protein KME46_26900 [Brasilonema angustatum HA4187-MV1]|jgi:hypothetical protein|nr:hypothetical protein [Brasilonema angustatum HA4187-MV1]